MLVDLDDIELVTENKVDMRMVIEYFDSVYRKSCLKMHKEKVRGWFGGRINLFVMLLFRDLF